jgi:hypothetical protein
MKIAYTASNKIGSFNLMYEVLNDGRNRSWLQALFGLCIILHVEENESGRGKTYIAASELFQPLNEGEEIPEYRIECELAKPFTEEEQAKALAGGKFKFYAVRKIIVRVPPAQMIMRPHLTH